MTKAQRVLRILEKHQPYAFASTVSSAAGKPFIGSPRQKSNNPLKQGRTSKKEPSKAQHRYRTANRIERARVKNSNDTQDRW